MQEILKKSVVSYGVGKYKSYRIPGIIVTKKGTILTYFETRLGRSDWSTRGVGLCRSEDNGNSFSELQLIAQTDKQEAINNPVMIAGDDGLVHFLWQIDYHRGFYQCSHDDGKTFGEPVEITKQLEAFREKFNWKVIAFGPGHGTQLRDGRLLVPVWLANGATDTDHGPSVCSVIISEDSGKTWKTGEIVGGNDELENANETCAAELSNGDIMLNIRHMGRPHFRAVSISRDGLTGFSKPAFDMALPDPICFGSICGTAKNESCCNVNGLLLFSNCASNPNAENFYSRDRVNLTLRVSTDDGKTWVHSRLLEKRSGYSDVAVSRDGEWFYCFYEHDVDDEIYSEPRHLTFARVNVDWLCDNERRF